MIPFPAHRLNYVWRNRVTSHIPVQNLAIHGNLLMLLQRRAWRGFVIRRVVLPGDGGEGVFQKRFLQIFENAFSVSTVGHDDDSSLRLVKADRVMPPAIVMTSFGKCFAIRRPVKGPPQSGTEPDGLVLIRSFFTERGEHAFRDDLNLWTEHL